ncbi:MAG: threonine synthase [Candidatus Gracilibacteria bacterium]
MLDRFEPHLYKLRCIHCENEVKEEDSHTRCPRCEGALNVEYDWANVRKEKPHLYPLKGDDVVSLKEGKTPLYEVESLRMELGVKNLFVKNEGANPTGVFKDRGTWVEVSKAKELGAKALIVASSGNMAASCSAYAGKAGIPMYVFVPQKVPLGKLAQIVSYGARVIRIQGSYNDCVRLVHEFAPKFDMYTLGDYVFRREGQKGLAYELCDDLALDGKESAPDVVIVPTGAGTHIAALWKGFQEYHKLGIIQKLPKMVAVQPQGAAVIVEAFENKDPIYKEWYETQTICSAVDVEDPNDGVLAVKAVMESGGTAVKLPDQDALYAQHLLASKEGIFTEHSSALALAAVKPLKESGFLGEEDSVVCIATGNGLKDPVIPFTYLPESATFEPKDERAIKKELKRLMKS